MDVELHACPRCGTFLVFDLLQDAYGLSCPACPYVAPIKDRKEVEIYLRLEKKEFEPIISDDNWNNASPTDATCPECSHDKAAHIEVPISDNVKSIFYKCLNDKCRNKWCKDVHM